MRNSRAIPIGMATARSTGRRRDPVVVERLHDEREDRAEQNDEREDGEEQVVGEERASRETGSRCCRVIAAGRPASR